MGKIKAYICSLCLLFIPFYSFGDIYLEQSEALANFEIISLGYACDIGIALRELNLRKKAYPFDWLRSSFSSLYRAIEDDFRCIFTDLKMNEKKHLFDYYGLEFPHEAISEVDLEDFPKLSSIKEKYDRRAERFINICKSDKKVIFIRYGLINFYELLKTNGNIKNQEQQEAILLRDLLHQKYPNLDFILIILSWDPNKNNESWNLERIRNFLHDPDDKSFIRKIIEKILAKKIY